MSFILEALKKSEKKHSRKSDQAVRTIHEPVRRTIAKSRSWTLWLLVALVLNATLLFWFFGPWRQPSSLQPAEAQNRPVATDKTPAAPHSKVAKPLQTAPLTTQSAVNPAPLVTQQQALPQVKEQPAAKVITVPRNNKKIYSFEQLPVSIQRRIPALQMALHAYNRDDAKASMVQLNKRIMREGDAVTDHVVLEQITAAGVVLKCDGYRFLLPRRGF